jgi:hypothetical protein
MRNKRFQFSLGTALLVITVAAGLLAAGVLLPPRLRQLLFSVLVFVASWGIVFLVLWMGEHIRARYGEPRSLPIGSMMLTSVSALVIILVLLPLPGGRGDVQLWVHDARAMFAFDLRGATMLSLFFSPLLCGLIGKLRLDLGSPARFGWLIAAIVSYIAAWYLVVTQAFLPLV